MGRYKVVRQAPSNRAQRRAAKKGKEYVDQGAGRRKGVRQLKPYSESGIKDEQSS